MASIGENLRATLLSLKQISDRVKSLVLTSVTKSEAESAKQEILGAIGNIPEPDLSDVAKESTITHGVQDIREDISHIQIDTSDLAKQGTNTSISLTTMDSKLGNYVLIQDEEYQYALLDLISRLD